MAVYTLHLLTDATIEGTPRSTLEAVVSPETFALSVTRLEGNVRATLRRIVAASRSSTTPTVFALAFSVAELQHQVATLLEQWEAAYMGCRSLLYSFDNEDLIMTCCYAEVPMRPFAIVDSLRPTDRDLLPYVPLPAVVGEVDAWGSTVARVETREALDEAVESVLREAPRVFVGAVGAVDAPRVRLFVSAHGPTAKLWYVSDAPASLSAAVEPIAKALAASVLVHEGAFEATFSVGPNPTGASVGDTLVLEHLRLGFPLWDSLATSSPTFSEFLRASAAHAIETQRARKANYVVVFDAKTKGYHLRSAVNIAKGDVVFRDEGRTFAIVTKENVKATWSEADKVTFSRYAWPLDGDGHVYAIWEDHPKRWRPINHSCDPTCVNAAPHSLNVIATRDIAAGEDLTMDYAVFCDFTMKPFQCHCGSAQCRGLIQPDAASLAKYGLNAWHRKQPDPNGGL